MIRKAQKNRMLSSWLTVFADSTLVKLLFLFICGLLASFTFHPDSTYITSICAFSCYLWVVDSGMQSSLQACRKSFQQFHSFLPHFVWAFGYCLGILHWCVYPFQINSGELAIFAPFALVALTLFFAVFLAIPGFLSSSLLFVSAPKALFAICFAILFAICEYIAAYSIFPFPWVIFGYTSTLFASARQSISDYYAQGLSLFGPHLMTVFNILVAQVIYVRNMRYSCTVLLFCGILLFFGFSRIEKYENQLHNINIAATQRYNNYSVITALWLNIVGDTTNGAGRKAFFIKELQILEKIKQIIQSKHYIRNNNTNNRNDHYMEHSNDIDNNQYKHQYKYEYKYEPSQTTQQYSNLLDLNKGSYIIDTLIILPESGLPFTIDNNLLNIPNFHQIIPENALLITGVDVAQYSAANHKRYNAMTFINSDGDILSKYYKHLLVPFGEYLPLRNFLSKFSMYQLIDGINFSNGLIPSFINSISLFDPVFDLRFVLEPQICYEAIIPRFYYNFNNQDLSYINNHINFNDKNVIFQGNDNSSHKVKAQIDCKLNLSNDIWFQQSIGVWQHFAIVRASAISYGTSVLRVANGGISGYIEPTGKLRENKCLIKDSNNNCLVFAVKIFQTLKANQASGNSMYSFYGDKIERNLPALMQLLCATIVFMMAVVVHLRRRLMYI